MVLVRDSGTGEIQQVSFADITGNTYSKAEIDAYTGVTNTRITNLETWSGETQNNS